MQEAVGSNPATPTSHKACVVSRFAEAPSFPILGGGMREVGIDGERFALRKHVCGSTTSGGFCWEEGLPPFSFLAEVACSVLLWSEVLFPTLKAYSFFN